MPDTVDVEYDTPAIEKSTLVPERGGGPELAGGLLPPPPPHATSSVLATAIDFKEWPRIIVAVVRRRARNGRG